jgi:hypothetical protein
VGVSLGITLTFQDFSRVRGVKEAPLSNCQKIN